MGGGNIPFAIDYNTVFFPVTQPRNIYISKFLKIRSRSIFLISEKMRNIRYFS